ncbi:MAG: hypothetical protein JW869_03355 [Candidatus Omnitrophica bacterium]|nr:hypothetical protein [Candidatus Omnitrophota bacterium]
MSKGSVWPVVLCVCVGVLVFSAGMPVCQAKGRPMTYAQAATLLGRLLEIEMPAGAHKLSRTEAFQIRAEGLAERGIKLEGDLRPDEKVTMADLANIIYDAVVGDTRATTEEKIDFMVKKGYISPDFREECYMELSYNEIIGVFSIPGLTNAVLKAYGPPEHSNEDKI